MDGWVDGWMGGWMDGITGEGGDNVGGVPRCHVTHVMDRSHGTSIIPDL